MSHYRPCAIILGILVTLAASSTVAQAARRCGCQPARAAAGLVQAVAILVDDGPVPTLAPPRQKSSSSVPSESTRLRRSNTIYVTVEAEAVAAEPAGR